MNRYTYADDDDEEDDEDYSWDSGDDFDYDEYVERHHSDSQVSKTLPVVWRVVAWGLLFLMASMLAWQLTHL